ncbi:SDR family NAD(P)-dependent oxidoreductase [Aestuariicella hydrocarbonica]|uniref:SDR family NAD(P)-dependent oxidoreductase n=1 Tax=Pseudomaricurvus hydrocarbonicus TaxID=1470433 RepID=A0A9E5JZR8_9GAMM|nr:SDR family NAD(P)-dependent oxidoreductase [Aestuariicella hydrocarbonica]NHO65687.1 SDR family NAD(P)-dependent oxidoreductase [Aestuariicella hydrocarbonica]
MQQPLTSPFSHVSTAEQVSAGLDLSHVHAIVTGATAGLGLETARVLALRGAQVTLLGRNQQAGDAIAKTLQAETGNTNIDMVSVDLNCLQSVTEFGNHINRSGQVVDLLINNAGIMAAPYQRNELGFESQLFINYVSHLLLSEALTPALLKSSAPRIVSLSSLGHHMSPVVLDDLNFENRAYDKWRAYGQSKTATALLAAYLHQQLGAAGVLSTAVHPGSIDTNLSRYLTPEERQAAISGGKSTYKTLQQGAATTLWAATSVLLEGHGGSYLEDCNIAPVVEKPNYQYGVMPYAISLEQANGLVHNVEAALGKPILRKF